jgi:protein-L-isoaspartate O-methyltransferase
MTRMYSLAQLKYMYISPLQEAWQSAQITRYCAAMEPVIKAYRSFYANTEEAVVVSMNERDERFLGDKTLTYGETRWTSFIKVLDALQLTPQDLFVDLGCGAGFLCFLANQAAGCKVEGYDIIHRFIENANQIVNDLKLEKIEFFNRDFFQSDLSKGTVFYITCTCFLPEDMVQLAHQLKRNRSGTRVVTVTRPLKGEHFRQIEKLKLGFSWGTDSVYIQERI